MCAARSRRQYDFRTVAPEQMRAEAPERRFSPLVRIPRAKPWYEHAESGLEMSIDTRYEVDETSVEMASTSSCMSCLLLWMPSALYAAARAVLTDPSE